MGKNRVDEFIKNPNKALLTLAIPIAIGMFVQSMYELADTAFVGRLGAESIAALTFSFPIFFILIAFNVGISAGMGSRISRFLGEKNKKQAENSAFHGVILSIILSVITYCILTFFLNDIFVALGAKDNVLFLAKEYMSIILLGIFFIFPSYALSSIFSAEGDTKTMMKIQIASLVLNIILDPILIYWVGMGIKGAAIATLLAFFLAFVLYIIYIYKKSYLKFNFESFNFSKNIMWDIFKVGIPASIMMFLITIYMLFLTKFMSHFGTDYVAAFGLVSQIESVTYIPILAFSTAILTLVGMFYGAKRYDLLKNVITYSLKSVTILTSIIGLIIFIFSPFIFRIFTDNLLLIGLATNYMRIDVFTFPLMGIISTISRMMQGFGDGFPGLMINIIRIFVVALPLAYFFVFILGYGYLSVAIATVIGGIISNIVGLIWLKIKLRKILSL